MTGQHELEQLRREGIAPIAVLLLDYPCKPWDVVDQIREGSIPALCCDKDEPPLTDCRFLKGARVHLACDDASRAVQWVDRLLLDGAVHIIQTTQGETVEWQA